MTQAYWLDGMRTELVAIQNGGWPAYDSVNRGAWVPVTIGQGPASATIQVGYWEDEPSGSTQVHYYMRPYQSVSTVDGSGAQPWTYANETQHPANCSIQCQINAVPGRVPYYSVNGGTPQVIAVP